MYKIIPFFVAFVSLSQALILETEKNNGISDDVGLNITEYVPKYGYPLECHDVPTEDGFIITIHRIPHGRNESGRTAKARPAVLLMHGLLSSSIDFVNSGPEKSIGFLLADAGYDVWLGNQRGNAWGRRNVDLDPVKNKTKYFDYSFNEIGQHDVAAFIDHILNVTGNEKIFYVGHSQGTSAFFALTATKPEYNEKIQLGVMLAPVAYISHATHPFLRLSSNYSGLLSFALKEIGVDEVLPHYPIITALGKDFCGDGNEFQPICADVFSLFAGHSDLLNKTLFPVIASNCPAGASIKQIVHYLQNYKSGYFRQYDYGFVGNLERYGQTTPPSYNTSQITSPLVFYWADNDLFSNIQDVDRLAEEVPNVSKVHVNNTGFTHIDYLWAGDILDLVNNNIMEVIQENTN